ncbi:putative deoxycytidylate deaminase [Apostichopus japonicus]|uniref:dCMP deaminase n=1 Tax=Stichopus japonicus TaxID=307972 RepID=A0A2G8K0P8_STIJA|nr:putative deoxycytidylate deaminase [Apostichopus japonicus]
MAVAFLSAQRSKDPNSQVGACITNSENKIVGIGYNGMPNGCKDSELPWGRAEDWLDSKYPYGCKIYVALFPCNECAKVIIQTGIREVVYYSDKYHKKPTMVASKKLLNLAGVTYRQYIPKKRQITIDFTSIDPDVHPTSNKEILNGL